MKFSPAFDRSSSLDTFVANFRERKLNIVLRERIDLAVDFGSGFQAPLLRHLLAQGRVRRGHAVDLSVDPEVASMDLSVQKMDLNSGVVSLADGVVDLAISLAVLEHLENPENLVREACRVLAPGRTFFLTTPAPVARPVLELMAYRLKLIDEPGIRDHKHYFTQKELRDLFIRCGFNSVRIFRFLLGLNTAVVGVK